MKANVHLKSQTFFNVNVKLNKSLNLYELINNNQTILVPEESINYMVEIPSKSVSKPTKKHKSTNRRRKK